MNKKNFKLKFFYVLAVSLLINNSYFIKAGDPCNNTVENGNLCELLQTYIYENKIDCLKKLIKEKVKDPNKPICSSNSTTLLNMACNSGNEVVVKFLLDEVGVTNLDEGDPLFTVLVKGYSKIAKLLISHGATMKVHHTDLLSSLDLEVFY